MSGDGGDRGVRGGPDISVNIKPFDIEESTRYQPLGLLGRGGMGEVQAALDLRLDREVALKVLRRPHPMAEARMVREASLAARLDHPGIVPILSAGRLPDGRAYYTMRVIRGRSLSEALSGARDLAARLTLVRPVLDAVEAVAYAHDHGVLHRDLKPANIMLGEHGATVVVDWGLATLLDDAPPAPERPAPQVSSPASETWAPGADPSRTYAMDGTPASSPSGEPPAPPIFEENATPWPASTGGHADWELTRPGQVFGTPAYMAPEQARGEPSARGMDVFALGGVLFQVLTGRPPRLSSDPTEPIPPVLAVCPGAPPELVAIAERALQADPSARYADAGELAADLGAWFEGRRVAAYAYTRWELLRRGVAAWRVPLTVAAVALVALATAVGIGWWRTVVERNKAIQAEKNAVDARASAERYLADALVAQSRVAVEQGWRARAEVMAAHRLLLGENAVARGLLSRTNGAPRPTLVRRVRRPDCRWTDLSIDGASAICLEPDRVLVTDAAGEVLASAPGAFVRARLLGKDGQDLVVMDAQSRVWRVDLRTGEATSLQVPPGTRLSTHRSSEGAVTLQSGRKMLVLRPGSDTPMEEPHVCEGVFGFVLSAFTGSGDFGAICPYGDGSELEAVIVHDGQRQRVFALPSDVGNPMLVELEPGPDGRLFVGTDQGWLLYQRPGETGLTRLRTDLPDLADMGTRGEQAVLQSVGGWASVWDLKSGSLVARLPTLVTRASWSADGTLYAAGNDLDFWRVGQDVMPTSYAAGGGVSSVSISPDGALLAWGNGAGQVQVVQRANGAVQFSRDLDLGVIKDLGFAPDGAQIAVGLAQGSVLLLDAQTGETRRELHAKGVRRIAWMDGDLFVAQYAEHTLRFHKAEGAGEPVPGFSGVGDLDAAPDGSGLVAIQDDGVVLRWDQGAPASARVGQLAGTQAGEYNKRYTYVIASQELHRLDSQGQDTTVPLTMPSCAMPLDVVASPREALVAVGCMTGVIVVLNAEDQSVVAQLEGHSARVGGLTFDPSGRWLVSGAWDAEVRVWDTSVLTTPPAVLVSELEAAWGIGLEEAIGR